MARHSRTSRNRNAAAKIPASPYIKRIIPFF